MYARFKKKKAARSAESTATPSPSPAEAPDRNTPIDLSEEDLLIKRACNFEEFSLPAFAPGVTIRDGLENCDDLTAYGVSEIDQKELWKDEIARLSEAVKSTNIPIHFKGSDEFKVDSKEAYESLARLADKMLVALNIVFNDSQGVMLSEMPDLSERRAILDKARRNLERFVADNSDDDDDDEAAQARNARPVASEINYADYFEFVNYVTATIARMLCKAAAGHLWHDTIIVKFAKMAAKMKVVSGDLREHAANSLQNTSSVKSPPNIGYGRPAGRNADFGYDSLGRNVLGDLDGMLEMLNQKENQPAFAGPNTSNRALTRLYYLFEYTIQMPTYKLFQYVLISLRGTNTLRTALSTSYEISAMLYKTGYGNFPVFLFQDIDGEYLGSSSDENINISHASFQVVNLAVNGLLHQRSLGPEGSQSESDTLGSRPNGGASESAGLSDTNITPPPSLNDPKSVGTTISCYYSEDPRSNASDQKRNFRLDTMSKVITVVVLMVLTSPSFVMTVNVFIGLFAYLEGSLIEGEPPTLYRPTEFEASFCLSTDEYRKTWGDRSGKGFASQLSDSLVARDTLLSWPSKRALRRTQTANMELPMAKTSQEEQEREDPENREEREQIQLNLKQFDQAQKHMKDWVFEEDGVRVRCDWYVGAVCTTAGLLVLGGITAGLTMGNRLRGVDPFNVTSFSWVLAAFIVLIAKSARVASWPWWDFLHRQVLCRSVSELRAVTGIDDQLLLARLLQEESGTRLQTRGPYNTVFSRKASGGDGFSIDQPLSIRTMLLSGLIMIQVQAVYHGKFLVCLDLRRGTELGLVSQTREAVVDEEECIIGERLTDEPAQGTIHRINLKTAKASWGRVVGVFGRKNAVFC